MEGVNKMQIFVADFQHQSSLGSRLQFIYIIKYVIFKPKPKFGELKSQPLHLEI